MTIACWLWKLATILYGGSSTPIETKLLKEFTNIKESMEALSNAIAQMGRRFNSQDSDNQNSGFASRNHEQETGSASRNNKTKVSNGGTTGGIQTRFSRVDFPQFNGEDPTCWIIRRRNFFSIRVLWIMKRCCLLLSICKMMLFNGTSGLRNNKPMFHGKLLCRPYMFDLDPLIMRILMRP